MRTSVPSYLFQLFSFFIRWKKRPWRNGVPDGCQDHFRLAPEQRGKRHRNTKCASWNRASTNIFRGTLSRQVRHISNLIPLRGPWPRREKCIRPLSCRRRVSPLNFLVATVEKPPRKDLPLFLFSIVLKYFHCVPFEHGSFNHFILPPLYPPCFISDLLWNILLLRARLWDTQPLLLLFHTPHGRAILRIYIPVLYLYVYDTHWYTHLLYIHTNVHIFCTLSVHS